MIFRIKRLPGFFWKILRIIIQTTSGDILMNKKIVIIGAGPGGYAAAVRAAQSGAEVTIIENDTIGGTCLNRGCIPSKIMQTTAALLDKFQRAEEFGIDADSKARLNIQRLMERKSKIIQTQISGLHSTLQHHNIRYISGTGCIRHNGVVIATPQQSEASEIPYDKLILAVGSSPSEIPGFPFDGEHILSSNHALDLRELPESLLIIGGGVIGCEFAFIMSAFGVKVTIVEALSGILPLPSVDDDCSKVLLREMKKSKINVLVNRSADSYETKNGKIHVTLTPSVFAKNLSERDKKPVIIEVDKILVCVGRKPDIAGMGLENISVKTDEKGWVIADENMETHAENVYAIGDILGPAKIMLAHVASTEGIISAENAMGGSRVMNYQVVPNAIFTMPEVANAGLTETQAKAQGFDVCSGKVLFRTLGKAHVIGEIAGEAKIVSDAASGKILGVHIVGPHATDLIAEATLAIQMGCSVKELAQTIHAHPTLAEIMMEASFEAMGGARNLR
jgi:dihydrolipoamide dehydrogenase